MARSFNTDGCCDPELNYMVDLSGRLEAINFNTKKKTGIKEIILGDKILIEAVV